MAVDVDLRGERIVARSPWQPGIAEAFSGIAGASWSKVRSEWSYPLNMHTLRSLRVVFGDTLRPTSALTAWARSERRRERTLNALASQGDAALGAAMRIAPKMAEAMAERPYQRNGAIWGARACSFLLADEPGLGKTVTVLAALMEGGHWSGSILAVGSKSSLFSVWARQIQMWTGASVHAMPEGAARRQKVWQEFLADQSSPKFLVVNPAMIRREYRHYCKKCDEFEPPRNKQWSRHQHYWEDHRTKRTIYKQDFGAILDYDWDAIVVDESHKLFAAYTPANVTQMVQGALDLRRGPDQPKIAMTGTPLRGEERKIWGTLDWMGVKTGGYWGLVDEFFEVASNGFGKVIRGLDPAKASEFYRLLDAHVLRRTRLEVRGDLPPSRRQDVLVEMSDKHRAQYDEFVRMGEVKLEEGSVGGLGMLSELTRVKQMAYGLWTRSARGKLTPSGESPKLDWLLNDFLAKRGVTGGRDAWFPEDGLAYKYVVASQFTEIIDDVERQLNRSGIKTLKITGAVTGRRRADAQTLFQSKDREFRVMLLNTTAGGESIELDAWCDEGVILDETFIADDQVQVEGRYENRSGRISPRMTWYVRTAGTIEQTIGDENFRQESIQHHLLDGRRGVTLARHLLRGEVIEWASGTSSNSSSSASSSRDASRRTSSDTTMVRATRKRRSAPASSDVSKSATVSSSRPRHRRRRLQS